MGTVDLGRRFLEWKEGDDADAGVWARLRIADGTSGSRPRSAGNAQCGTPERQH